MADITGSLSAGGPWGMLAGAGLQVFGNMFNKNEEKKVTIQKETVRQQEKPVNTTKKTEPEKKVEQKTTFNVPDIETLPKSLTSLPNFDPASAKSVEFIDENGDPKIYLEGRIYPGMRKSAGFNMHKPAAEKI